ncbi:WD40 repeat-like protein [Cubamyces sp. BRFM 1775]|nr:WD40 repeat-like protein [Cubamyces sp. BRFM 1775]
MEACRTRCTRRLLVYILTGLLVPFVPSPCQPPLLCPPAPTGNCIAMPLCCIKLGCASPPPSTRPLLKSTTGTQPASTTEDSRGKELVKTSMNGLILALNTMKEASSACPQLQLAVGTLLAVLEAYKKYSEASEAIETLLSRINSLTDILEKIPSKDSCPQALKERLDSLASKLKDAAEDAKRMKSKRRIIQCLNAADYAARIESWVKKLNEYINNFLQGFNSIDKTLAHDALRKALRPVIEALWHNGDSVHVQCHKNTRMEVLATLCSWLHPNHPRLAQLPAPVVPALSDRSILWIHALAGSGKSTIALTIADWWDKDELLGASFFCARDGNRSNVNCIFRTIAYRLANRFPAFREQLTKVLEKDPDLYSSTPTRQLEKLIVEPLQAVRADATSPDTFPPHVAVVIDALDECTDNNAVSTILKSLALYIGQLPPLKFIITSRLEQNIARGFLLQNIRDNTQDLALNEISNDLTRRDISLFLEWRLAAIRDHFHLSASWPAPGQIDNLVDLSEHLFIFAASAARYIADEAELDPDGRLTSLLNAGNAAAERRGTSTSPFPILDMLYIQVLENAARRLGDNPKARLNLVLGTIVLAEERLSPTALDALLDLPSGAVGLVLPVLSAILTFPNGDSDPTPIGIIHLSFPNFLVDPTRCTDQTFLVRPRIQHSHIAFRCLKLMQALKYNILEVTSEHDCELLSGSYDGTVNLWDVATGANLNTWEAHTGCVRSVAWSPDGTLAAFASDDETVRLWRVASPEKMVVLRHSLLVCHVIFSPDGDLLSGSWDETCKIWDTRSIDWDSETDIEPIRTLKHDSEVCTVAVSSDSRLIACGLYSGEIILWTKSDGQQVRSLPGRSEVISLTFYPSGLLAAAYEHSPITLWNVSTGARVKTASNERADAATFAPDGLHIAHATGHQLQIHLWPSEVKRNAPRTVSITGILKQVARGSTVEDRELRGDRQTNLQAVTISPTGKLILVVYGDELRIFEGSTGRCMRTINHSSGVYPCATWSPTGNLFACTGRDYAVHMWKADTGELSETFTGHWDDVTGVAFTPDEQHVLSASDDGTIRRGKIGQNGQRIPSDVLFQSDRDHIRAFAVSSDGRWILSAAYQRHSPPDTSNANLLVAPSRQPVADKYGKYYALRLHDATTGRVFWIEHLPSWITSVAFSEDCTRALAGTDEGEVFLYDLTQLIPPNNTSPRPSPPLAVPEHKLSGRVASAIQHISFSPDGRAVITNRLQPLLVHIPNRCSTPFFFYDEDWLCRASPGLDPRRLCWIPPSFRPHEASTDSFPSPGGSLLVLDDTSAS